MKNSTAVEATSLDHTAAAPKEVVYSNIEGVSEEFSQSFGNYLLHGIAEVELPNVVSWFPQTIGWQVLTGLLFLYLAYRAILSIQHWRHNRYRRDAIQLISNLMSQHSGDAVSGAPRQVLKALPKILKLTALQAYPRETVAQLSGHSWLQFLDDHYSGPKFNDHLGRELLRISYQDDFDVQLELDDSETLVSMAILWIDKHIAAEVTS